MEDLESYDFGWKLNAQRKSLNFKIPNLDLD